LYIDYTEDYVGEDAGYQGRDVFFQFYNDTYNAQAYKGGDINEATGEEISKTGYGAYFLYDMNNST